jgi:hypothetical protein
MLIFIYIISIRLLITQSLFLLVLLIKEDYQHQMSNLLEKDFSILFKKMVVIEEVDIMVKINCQYFVLVNHLRVNLIIFPDFDC